MFYPFYLFTECGGGAKSGLPPPDPPSPAGDLLQTAGGETFGEAFVSHSADELLPRWSAGIIEFG